MYTHTHTGVLCVCSLSGYTRLLATNRAVMVARARLSPQDPGSAGAALHRSVGQHVLVIL